MYVTLSLFLYFYDSSATGKYLISLPSRTSRIMFAWNWLTKVRQQAWSEFARSSRTQLAMQTVYQQFRPTNMLSIYTLPPPVTLLRLIAAWQLFRGNRPPRNLTGPTATKKPRRFRFGPLLLGRQHLCPLNKDKVSSNVEYFFSVTHTRLFLIGFRLAPCLHL